MTLIVFGAICIILLSTDNHYNRWHSVAIRITNIPVFFIIIVGVLAVLNWVLESLKWQMLIRRIEQVSLMNAFMAVLTGLSFGFVTPRSIGDYFGRMLHLKSKSRSRVVGALVISRLSQLFITLLFGGFGLMYFVYNDFLFGTEDLRFNLILAFILFLIVILIIVLRKWIIRKLISSRLGDRVVKLISIIKEYNNAEILASIGLSMLRYFIFSTQFVMILWVLGFNEGLIGMYLGVSLVYLAKSVFISFNFLSDLGVRELASLGFLGCLSNQTEVIITSSLIIWLINILLPTIVGALMTYFIKLRPE